MDELKFKVVEIFDSIDGEGKRTGELTTFIRLGGCNLRCSYCDTSYAQNFTDGEEMSIFEIIDKCKSIGNKNITLTGGEPLARDSIFDLIDKLALFRFYVNIETNGSIPIYNNPKLKNVFYTMDYKCPSSGMQSKMDLKNLYFLDDNDVLKFVVGNQDDLEMAYVILSKYDIKAQIYLSPVFGKIDVKDIIEFMKKKRNVFHNARVQIQLHKVIWEPNERGV